MTDSTNIRARELAARGAARHAGHGLRADGRARPAGPDVGGAAGSALLCSLVIRDPPRLLSLAAGAAVAKTVEAMRPPDPVSKIWQYVETGGTAAVALKWPNHVPAAGAQGRGYLWS